ncbi:MAG: hypothetical protein VBE63_17535 [Lamprobacter sp.]|uniref:hypothetical protein n=1 Tax=Lamprobacter sp. TaxID=3100796 RepID=UPI002B2594C2|nr:hypothetical protein [Lamprobacter sp.]MEA3641720.1 hypothetical protein [Lamprobacter sp.]
MLERYEHRLLTHVREFFPKNVAMLGDDGAQAAVRYAIGRAQAYGLAAEQDIAIYVDLVFAFGRDFDGHCPWARDILNSPRIPNPRARADVLFHTAIQQPEESATGIACPESS